MMEGMTAVKVAARVRPLVKREKDEGARICMTARPTDNAIDINNSITFTYDMVFGVDSTQEEVYEAAAAPLLDKLFHGYNATIFAYGQTGSGKTHSMGTEDFHTDTLVSVSEQGIIPRVAAAIFARARQLPSASVAVSVSMLEIYEEKVHDLLGAGANLAIREAGGQVFVQDLREVQVHSPQETMRQLEEGSNGRSKGATAMNARSSRSHAVFTISLAIAHNDDCDEAGANLRSKLHLVDLAGSERLKKTQATGERRKEGIKINEGLTVLGNVINALVENSKHVPYRNSKLTRILQDSLGGNSFTLMLVCVSPADSNSFESMNSLRYADRAKQIKNKPTVNVDPAAAELKRLRDANRELREQLEEARSGGGVSAAKGEAAELARVKETLGVRETELATVRERLSKTAKDRIFLLAQVSEVSEQKETLAERLAALKSGLLETAEEEKQEAGREETVRKLEALAAGAVGSTPRLDRSTRKRDAEGALEKTTDDEDEEEEETEAEARHNALSEKMQHIMEEIEKKTEMVESCAGGRELEKMREGHETELSQLRAQIEKLEKEKRELEQQQRTKSAVAKISEERRRRMLDLERELSDLRKKQSERQKQERLIKQQEETLKQRQGEITALKRLRCSSASRSGPRTTASGRWRWPRSERSTACGRRSARPRRSTPATRTTRSRRCSATSDATRRARLSPNDSRTNSSVSTSPSDGQTPTLSSTSARSGRSWSRSSSSSPPSRKLDRTSKPRLSSDELSSPTARGSRRRSGDCSELSTPLTRPPSADAATTESWRPTSRNCGWRIFAVAIRRWRSRSDCATWRSSR